MTRTITLHFTWPPRELNPNAMTKTVVLADGTRKRKAIPWWEKRAAVKAYREDCGWMAKTQVQPGQDIHTDRPFGAPVLATTTFYVDSKRKYDMRNLDAMLKPLWDGIVDAGILADDDYKHLRHAESKLVVGKEKRVEVVLEEVE